LTSASSSGNTGFADMDELCEEQDDEKQISCTKGDGDADGSAGIVPMKSGSARGERAKKKGSLFKTLGRAIGLKKKDKEIGQDFGRVSL